MPLHPGTGVVTSGGLQRRLIGNTFTSFGAVARLGLSGSIARLFVGVHSAGRIRMRSLCLRVRVERVVVGWLRGGVRRREAGERGKRSALRKEVVCTRFESG